MRRYEAVICDMFDTLVNFLWDRLPLVPFDGQEIRSSSPLIYGAVQSACPGVSLSEFCRAFIECSREAEALRNNTQREVTAHERFRRLRHRLGISDGAIADAFVQRAIAAQMRQLRLAMEFPEENRAALEALGPRYRMAVVSNFDHGPTVEAAFESNVDPGYSNYMLTSQLLPVIIQPALSRQATRPGQHYVNPQLPRTLADDPPTIR